MPTKKKYNWKITAKKALVVTAEVFVAGLLLYFTDNGVFLFMIPALEAFRNYLKHKDW